MDNTKKQQQQDAQAEQEQNQAERVNGKITIIHNADGTYTGNAGKQSHTTRKTPTWDF